MQLIPKIGIHFGIGLYLVKIIYVGEVYLLAHAEKCADEGAMDFLLSGAAVQRRV